MSNTSGPISRVEACWDNKDISSPDLSPPLRLRTPCAHSLSMPVCHLERCSVIILPHYAYRSKAIDQHVRAATRYDVSHTRVQCRVCSMPGPRKTIMMHPSSGSR
eukprot:307223-Rhodomonas_salina.3